MNKVKLWILFLFLFCLIFGINAKEKKPKFKIGDYVYVMSDIRPFGYTNKKSCIIYFVKTKKEGYLYIVNLYCEDNIFLLCYENELYYE